MPRGVYERTEYHKKINSIGQSGKKMSDESRKKISINNARYWLGKKHTKETKLKISLAGMNRKVSELTREKMSESHLGKNIGDKNGQWKGGITPLNKKIRKSRKDLNWVNTVFTRDNYTDQKTGIKGGNLHPHHILNFSQYPKLRFEIDNGITLSEESHKKFHKKYGQINNTKEQLLEFLK